MRGFSTIEILIAIVLLAMTVIAVSTLTLGMPVTVIRAEREADALMQARNILTQITNSARTTYPSAFSSASSTTGIFTSSFTIEPLEDESFSSVRAVISWTDLFGADETRIIETRISDASSVKTVCDPFVSGDWSHPSLLASYALLPSGILGDQAAGGTYSITDLASTPTALIVAVGSTTKVAASTLFFFSVHGTSTPILTGAFDNATTSRVGFSSVAADGSYVFAGNGFGSVSAATCSGNVNCAQLQIFSIPDQGTPARIAALTLATSSAPYARTSDGSTAAVSALAYYKQYLYLGLQKTSGGFEFNIIDVGDPAHPRWVSGAPVGRTINDITVRGDYAYVSTDDSTRELMVFDVRDRAHPALLGTWDAPGSSTFGYGAASTVHGTSIRFGRSYSPNSPEFELLDSSNLAHIREVQGVDGGTAHDPESVRDMYTQDRLTFTLLSHRLEFWDTSDPGRMSIFAPPYQLPGNSDGVALACRNNLLYVARNAADGTGYIDVLRGV